MFQIGIKAYQWINAFPARMSPGTMKVHVRSAR